MVGVGCRQTASTSLFSLSSSTEPLVQIPGVISSSAILVRLPCTRRESPSIPFHFTNTTSERWAQTGSVSSTCNISGSDGVKGVGGGRAAFTVPSSSSHLLLCRTCFRGDKLGSKTEKHQGLKNITLRIGRWLLVRAESLKMVSVRLGPRIDW